jgi:mannonate dehydratase
MQMTLRWFGSNNDSVTLKQIKQIPGVAGVISALHDIPVGEAWKPEDIQRLKKEVEDGGLKLCGIESVNVHEDIKLGLPTREKYIENYKLSLENLGKADIHLVCYNFMPIFTGQGPTWQCPFRTARLP